MSMCDNWHDPCMDKLGGLQNRPLYLVRHMKYAAQKDIRNPNCLHY